MYLYLTFLRRVFFAGTRASYRGTTEREEEWEMEVVSTLEESLLHTLRSKTYLQRRGKKRPDVN